LLGLFAAALLAPSCRKGFFIDYNREIYSVLWISRKVQYRLEFDGRNAPRGTFLWNGNPQILVFVENFLFPCLLALRFVSIKPSVSTVWSDHYIFIIFGPVGLSVEHGIIF
jgi:hypothetical protein